MDLLSFIRTADPITIRIGEKERDEDEPKLLETTIGRVVPLLPVAPDRSSGELEASVDKLFDEGRSGEQAGQGDSASGGHGVGVQLVDVIAETNVEDVTPAELQRQKKRKTKVVDAAVQRLLAGAVQHAEVRGGVMPTLPFVSSSVSTTPEREGGDHTELLVGANLRTLEAPQRFVISSDSSDHSGVNIAEAEVDYVVWTSVPIMTSATTATLTADPAAIAKERLVGSSVFGGDSSSADRSHPISGGFSDRTGSDFLVGGIRTVVDPDSNLQRVYYNIKEKRRLKSVVEKKNSLLKSRCDEIESLKAQLLIKEAEAAEVVRLRDEAQALKVRNTNLKKEKSELEVKVTDLAALLNVKEQEIADFDTVVTSVKLHNDSRADQVCMCIGWRLPHPDFRKKVAVYENFMSLLEQFQDEKMKESVNFPLIAELKAKKDASVEVIMNLLRLEDAFAEKLGLVESQSHVDQLMVPIHHSPDQRVVALHGVFVPLSEPLSAMALEGMEDDYEIAHTEGGEDADADVEAVVDEGVDHFPDVSGAELDVSE
nr:hypothetical protein [Tanacetum cinerariifolium]GEY62573.1 hypothetical protein [Tanacetum cinerariifolium]